MTPPPPYIYSLPHISIYILFRGWRSTTSVCVSLPRNLWMNSDNLDSVLSCVLCKILHCSQMAHFGLVNNGTSLWLNSYGPKQGASWWVLSSVVTGHEHAAWCKNYDVVLVMAFFETEKNYCPVCQSCMQHSPSAVTHKHVEQTSSVAARLYAIFKFQYAQQLCHQWVLGTVLTTSTDISALHTETTGHAVLTTYLQLLFCGMRGWSKFNSLMVNQRQTVCLLLTDHWAGLQLAKLTKHYTLQVFYFHKHFSLMGNMAHRFLPFLPFQL